jgi:hypothetical protein
MSEIDPDTQAWLAKRASEAQARRRAVMKEMDAIAAASGARPAGPNEEPMGTWSQEFGPGSSRMPDTPPPLLADRDESSPDD